MVLMYCYSKPGQQEASNAETCFLNLLFKPVYAPSDCSGDVSIHGNDLEIMYSVCNVYYVVCE